MKFLDTYCRQELDEINEKLRQVTCNSEPIIREVSEYIQETPGKQLRPSILVLSSKMFNYDGQDHVSLGAALELVHTATLIHDDIVDKATTRRGKTSVNARWGTETALLVADFYFATAYKLVVETGIIQLAAHLSDIASRMCEGELFQHAVKGKILKRSDYFRIIKYKTAYLFSACAEFGAIIAHALPDNIKRMSDYGMALGMAFQITDDLLDFTATDAHWGKTIGVDILQGKQTLPFIYAHESASPDHQQELEFFINDGKNAKKITNIIKKYDGFDYTLKTAGYFVRQAKDHIAPIEDSHFKTALIQTADYIVSRSF